MGERRITVFIYLPGEAVAVPAGVFTHDDDPGIGSFAYGRGYRPRENALPVDPIALPLGPAPREVTINGGLYGAFRDAAPDHWGRLVIAAEAKAPPEALTKIEFLLATNATRVGNLDFRTSPDDAEPALAPPGFSRLPDLMRAAREVEAGGEVEPHLLQLLRQGTSMGGARPKSTVELDGALWIAKFPARDDTLDIPRIEYATMTLAGRCGIETAGVRLEAIGDRSVLLARRFDRAQGRAGWIRQGFVSALSLMEWDEAERNHWSYPGIAAALRRYASAASLQELFRRMVFNILVRNTDDHPRNHGFLVEGHELSLAPAYDLVPTLTRQGVGTEFSLAMSVGEQGRTASLDNALSRASQFGLERGQARAVVEELRASVRSWRDHFEECGVTGSEIDALAPSFEGSDPGS